MYQRLAIYYTPEAGSDLARLGAEWLGRDALTGAPVEQAAPVLPGCRAMANLTEAPRRYGLHATLKPPMRLAPGYFADDLLEQMAVWAMRRAPVDAGAMRIAALGSFLALVPVEQGAALDALAADLVRDFDHFRALPADGELARRRLHGLSPRQESLLADWGYPYVMEEFRFHITLTDRLDAHERAPVETAAAAHFAPVLAVPLRIGAVAVFGEDAQGAFHLVRSFPLQG